MLAAVTPAEMYADTRERLVELFASLTEEQLRHTVPATPAWTVKDVAAHLAGVADDVSAGRVEGAATDPWTAKQVEARRDTPLPEILAEWREKGPRVDGLFEVAGPGAFRLVIDAVTHEQDVRGALGLPGGRDTRAAAWSLQQLLGAVDGRVRSKHLPPLRVAAGDDEWILGTKEGSDPAVPAATLRATHFELLRGLIGRRSVAQLRAYAWEGDAEPYIPLLAVFPPAQHDIAE